MARGGSSGALVFGALLVGGAIIALTRRTPSSSSSSSAPPLPAVPPGGAFAPFDPFSNQGGYAMTGPRGIRNNNPGNLDFIAPPELPWNGQVGTDGRFGIYDTAAHGVRALAHQLLKDFRAGAQTLTDLITEWAPPSENDTGAYILAVSNAAGIAPDEPLDLQSNLPAVTAAIIQHENGEQPYSPDDLATWVYS